MADLKRTIAALSKMIGDGDRDGSVTPDNAGDSFGGRQSKQQKKEWLLHSLMGTLYTYGIAMYAGLRWWTMWCSRSTQRHIAAHNSSIRRTAQCRVSRVRNDSSSVVYDNLELDSHADTIVLGSNCVIMSHTGRECDVSPFTEAYKSISNMPIVSGATAYTCQETGDTYILVFHEALWMGNVMDHTLINPNQLRHFGIHVQDNPYGDTPMHISTESREIYLPLHRREQQFTSTLALRLTKNFMNAYMSSCPPNCRGIHTPSNSLPLNGVGRRD